MICYVATHNDTRRRYVGITNRSLPLRKSTHENRAKHQADHTFFHQAIRAYGPAAFSWQVVATGDKDVIRLLEHALIATYRTNDPRHGFNSTGGREFIDHPPLTDRPADLTFPELPNPDLLDMLNDLDQIVSWVERNHPDADRCTDLRELCRRLLHRLDDLDPPVPDVAP